MHLQKAPSIDKWVGIPQSVHWLHYGLDKDRLVIRFPARPRCYSLIHRAQSASGPHPSPCAMCTGSSATAGDKEAVAWIWTLTQSTAKMEKERSSNSSLPYAFTACTGKDFYIYFTYCPTEWRTKCHIIDCTHNTFLFLQNHLTSGTEVILIGWNIVTNESL